MRLMVRENAWGWIMTGILGRNARWFFGFTRANKNRLTADPSKLVQK